MRIVQIADLYPPLVGGTERHTAGLAEALAERGHHSVVATLSVPGAPAFEVGPRGERIHRIWRGWAGLVPGARTTERPHHPSFPDPGVARALRHILHLEKPDVIYGHNWMLYSALFGTTSSDARVVTVAHDYGLVCPARTMLRADGSSCDHSRPSAAFRCAVETYGHVRGPVIATGLLGSLRWLNPRIDLFLAISQAVADGSRTATDKTIEVMPTFLADGLARIAEDTPRPESLPDGPYILYVGALGRFKGIHVLLDAYAELPAAKPPLVVIGTPKPDMPRRWPEGVQRLDNLPHDQVMSAWRHALFGVVPSVWPEAFGQVAAEALTAGRPIIASATGGLTDIVEHGVTGLLVPPAEPTALRDAMFMLLDDPAYADRMGAHGASIADRFTVGRVADRIERRLTELLDS